MERVSMSNILPSARVVAGKVQFTEGDGFARARRMGAFHLKHPEGWDFSAGITLAENYYLEQDGGACDAYRGFHRKDLGNTLLGYSRTGDDQDELLQLE